MRKKLLAVGVVLLVLLAGLAWFSSFLWFPGITPAQTARILIGDYKFGWRAVGMSVFWGDLILEPLREASKDFTSLNIRNSFRVAEVLARNGSERSVAIASELYRREDLVASMVGAAGLAAHGKLPESAFQPGGRLHRVLVDERYLCRYDAQGERDRENEPLTANELELAMIAAGHARSRASVPATLAWIDACSSDPSVQSYAADALGAIGDPRAVPVLRKSLRSPESYRESSTFCALVALGDPQAVPLAIERIPKESRDYPGVVPELEAVTGESFGFDKARWREWWRTQGGSGVRRRCPG